MSCSTCSHTMALVGHQIFWCPRCGTILDEADDNADSTAPYLVQRCREFAVAFRNPVASAVAANLSMLWHSSGIAESLGSQE
jgi:predicted RNA-binding Zn-ribbon protein involved in translation (DUF1610 family)